MLLKQQVTALSRIMRITYASVSCKTSHESPKVKVFSFEHDMVIPGPSPGYLSQYGSFPGPPMATCHSTVSFPGPPLATCHSTAHFQALPWLPVTVRLISRPSHGYL